VLDALEKAGSAHGKTIAQTALRWLLQRPAVTSVITAPPVSVSLLKMQVQQDGALRRKKWITLQPQGSRLFLTRRAISSHLTLDKSYIPFDMPEYPMPVNSYS
jgi:hypothetical protein